MAYWLVKSEPGHWSWDDHVRKGVEGWDGVRNHQAANNLKAMKRGDLAFFYHSGPEKRIMGVIEVARESYPDDTDPSGRFVKVDFKALRPLTRPVSLEEIKRHGGLDHLMLVRHSRLSVMPIDDKAWQTIAKMGGVRP